MGDEDFDDEARTAGVGGPDVRRPDLRPPAPPPVVPWASPDLEVYVLGLLDRLDEGG
jgi:hypothetical protein